MVDKLETGKLYKWLDVYYCIMEVNMYSETIKYFVLENPNSVLIAPYNPARKLLEEV